MVGKPLTANSPQQAGNAQFRVYKLYGDTPAFSTPPKILSVSVMMGGTEVTDAYMHARSREAKELVLHVHLQLVLYDLLFCCVGLGWDRHMSSKAAPVSTFQLHGAVDYDQQWAAWPHVNP